MSNDPNWKKDFPIRQSSEHEVSRRQFCKVAGCAALTVGAGWLAKDKIFALPPAMTPKLVGSVAEMPVGGARDNVAASVARSLFMPVWLWLSLPDWL